MSTDRTILLGGVRLDSRDLTLLTGAMQPLPFKLREPWPGLTDVLGFQWRNEKCDIRGVYFVAADNPQEIEVLIAASGDVTIPPAAPMKLRLPIKDGKLPQYRAVGSAVKRVFSDARRQLESPEQASIPKRTAIYVGHNLARYLSSRATGGSVSGRLETLAERYQELMARCCPELTESEWKVVTLAYQYSALPETAAKLDASALMLVSAIQQRDLANTLPDQGRGLCQRLQSLTYAEQVALLDRCEQLTR